MTQIRAGPGRSQFGSMVARFNPNGTSIAFHCTAYMRNNHEIIVLNVYQLQVTHNLLGHLGVIYDLDWLNDSVLVSVSTDRTAIVWYLTESNFKMTVCFEFCDIIDLYMYFGCEALVTLPIRFCRIHRSYMHANG